MPPSQRKPLPLALSLLTLLLPACASPTIGLTSAADTAKSIGHVRPSKADTCDTQEQIAAQSSRIDTLIEGTEKVYKSDCQKKPSVVASKG